MRLYTPNAEKSTTCPVGLRPDQFLNKAGGLPEYSRHELEGMYLVGRGPGIVVEDELEKKAITLIKMDGSYRDVSFDPYPITKYGEPSDAKYTQQWKAYGDFRHSNIHVINTKSKWRPFRICRPDKGVERGWPRHHNLLVTPYMPVHKLTHLIPCFPAGSDRKTGYFLAGLGQMTCAEHWQVTKDSISEIWLNGCTDSREPAKELAALARSWQNAPKMSLIADNGAEVQGYSIGERVYLADVLKVKGSKSVAVELAASEDSPAVNPAFLINKWGKAKPRLKVDGKIMRAGTDFRFGYYKTLGTEDGRVWKDALIMWVKLHSTKPVQIAF